MNILSTKKYDSNRRFWKIVASCINDLPSLLIATVRAGVFVKGVVNVMVCRTGAEPQFATPQQEPHAFDTVPDTPERSSLRRRKEHFLKM